MKDDLLYRFTIWMYGFAFVASTILMTFAQPCFFKWNLPVTGIACSLFGIGGAVSAIVGANSFSDKWKKS